MFAIRCLVHREIHGIQKNESCICTENRLKQNYLYKASNSFFPSDLRVEIVSDKFIYIFVIYGLKPQ